MNGRTLQVGGMIILGILLGSVGCIERKLTVTSEPDGALVFLNNQEIGRTPVTRDFTWYGDYEVQLRQDGYETLKTGKRVTARWWQWFPIDLLAEVTPFRWRDKQAVHFTMKPAASQSDDPAVMLDRAAEMRGQLQSSPHTRSPSTQPIVKQ